jgi:REP element-mobilizing transposase RayT
MPGVELKQMDFDEDHVHFIIGIPPKYAIADVMDFSNMNPTALK